MYELQLLRRVRSSQALYLLSASSDPSLPRISRHGFANTAREIQANDSSASPDDRRHLVSPAIPKHEQEKHGSGCEQDGARMQQRSRDAPGSIPRQNPSPYPLQRSISREQDVASGSTAASRKVFQEKFLAEHEDPINQAVSRLAMEAIEEMKRVSASGDLQRQEIKQTIWNITELFRTVIREQIQRSGKDFANRTGRTLSPAQASRDFNITNSIISIASYAKSELTMPGAALHDTDVRTKLAAMLHSYRDLMEREGEALEEMHVSMILHRVSTLAAMTKQEIWVLQEHRDLIETILSQVSRHVHEMSASSYGFVIRSLCRFGPRIRMLTVSGKSYSYFYQEILDHTQKEFHKMTVADMQNITTGCGWSGMSPVILGPFVRAWTQLIMARAEEFTASDLASFAWSFANIPVRCNPRLFDRFCTVADKKIDDFSQDTLPSFLRGLALLGHSGNHSFVDTAAKKVEQETDRYNFVQLLYAIHGLVGLRHYPKETLLKQMLEKVSEGDKTGLLRPGIDCLFLAICTELDLRDEDSLRLCKRLLVHRAERYNPNGIAKMLWAFSSFNAFDEPVLQALKRTSFANQKVKNLTPDHCRQLCRMLITMRILQKQERPEFVSREMEEMCYAVWRNSLRNRVSFGAVHEVFSILGRAGFDCKESWTLEKVPMRLSTATLPASVSGLEKDLDIAVEVITRNQVFYNNESVLVPVPRWRRSLLEALGWIVLPIRTVHWNALSDQNSRASYLHDLIKERTGHSVEKLSMFERETKHQLEIVQKSDDMEDSDDDDDGIEARSDLQQMIRNEEKATLSSEDLGHYSKSLKDDALFQDVVQSPEPPASTPDKNSEEGEVPPSDLDEATPEENDIDHADPGVELNEGDSLMEESDDKGEMHVDGDGDLFQGEQEYMSVSESDDEMRSAPEFDTVLDGSSDHLERNNANDGRPAGAVSDDVTSGDDDIQAVDHVEHHHVSTADIDFQRLLEEEDSSKQRGREGRKRRGP